MFSHQQSPGVVYREFFVTRSKIEETDHIPGDYLVTLLSFGRFIRQENPNYRFLKSGNNIIAIFTKSTYSVPASTKLCLIEVKSKLALQRTKK